MRRCILYPNPYNPECMKLLMFLQAWQHVMNAFAWVIFLHYFLPSLELSILNRIFPPSSFMSSLVATLPWLIYLNYYLPSLDIYICTSRYLPSLELELYIYLPPCSDIPSPILCTRKYCFFSQLLSTFLKYRDGSCKSSAYITLHYTALKYTKDLCKLPKSFVNFKGWI